MPPKSKMDERFLDLVEEVKVREGIRSDLQMSKVLGLSNGYIHKIRVGELSANVTAIEQMVTHFEANPTYILLGVGERFQAHGHPKPPKGSMPGEYNRKMAKQIAEAAQEPVVKVYEPDPIDARVAVLEQKLERLTSRIELLIRQLSSV